MRETKQQQVDTIKKDCLQRYGKESISPKPFTNLTWKYVVTLRKLEYFPQEKMGAINCSTNIMGLSQSLCKPSN